MATAYSVQRISWFSSTPVSAVEQPLDGPQDRIHECPLAVEHARHEDAQRLGHREDQQQENSEFEAIH